MTDEENTALGCCVAGVVVIVLAIALTVFIALHLAG